MLVAAAAQKDVNRANNTILVHTGTMGQRNLAPPGAPRPAEQPLFRASV